MGRSRPSVRGGLLYQNMEDAAPSEGVYLGSAEWYSWLDGNSTFVFDNPVMHFTARKEKRSGGWYWYAYRRHQGKLRTAYIGKTDEVTLDRLNAVAASLHQTAALTDIEPAERAQAGMVSGKHTSASAHAEASPAPLPVPLTALVGRTQDVEAALALFRRPEVRLVSLTGMGGVGKTRLALQVALELRGEFADGVYFVGLSPVRDAQLVTANIAQALGLKENAGSALFDTVKAYLQEKHALLVLDNFEQVMPAAEMLVDLLSASTMLKILVTSREVLHLCGEHHFPVAPLAFPDPGRMPSLDMLEYYPAVELFLQRAQSIVPDMALNPATMGAIARVCARVEGLPLAIELAAARVKLLPPQALATRLDHRLDVLTQGGPDMPARHKTLRATFAWSRNLLSDDEQRVFRRLSVFAGGCTLEAAEGVCNSAPDLTESFLDVMSSLVDKSLLQTAMGDADEPRVFLLETIREYASECLGEAGETETVQAAHAAYFLAFAEQVSSELYGRQEEMWLDKLEQDSENLRAAFGFLLAQHDHFRAARLTNALGRFWQARGRASEGLDWATQAQASALREGHRSGLKDMEIRRVEAGVGGEQGGFRVGRSGMARPAGLTKREMEALLLVAEGLSNDEIAGRLVVSTSTVKTYLSAIYAKLRVSSRTAAMRYVIDNYLNMA